MSVSDYIVGYASDVAISKVTKNTIAAAAAGLLLLLVRKKAKAAEVPATSEGVIPKVESTEKATSGVVVNTFGPSNTQYEDDPHSIFIQYPGLKVWVPQKEVAGGSSDVDQLIDQARAVNTVS